MIPDTVANRPLPVQRAFVVQLHATAAVAQGQLAGRVEHVVSGQAAHFHTLEELLAFMARVLAALDTAPEETPYVRLPHHCMERRKHSMCL